ncbi:MAG: single-stranded-DNA-specific exonuclease RecJ [Clostridia bacterium]|nr:single-stranded-DNA-specific exonuclease RecJ [Clostridia bacterium]
MLRFVERKTYDVGTDEAVANLAAQTGYDPCLCSLLVMRNVCDKETAEGFLAPSFSQLHDPFLFSQMQAATERIKRAEEEHERVCIYGDYDVDGVCATSILYTYLRHRGFDVMYYIPSRKNEGYGMNVRAVEYLHELGVNLIITVDNGITAPREIQRAKDLGMEVIITDHHKCTGEAPSCTAVLCHTIPSETYPNKSLCGAGTALKLVQALGDDEAARAFLPFAGLATVADVVELHGENRALVALALQAINDGDVPVGIKAVLEVAMPNNKRPINEYDFAFCIAPRLNAAGRMDSANIGVELLCSSDYEKALELAHKLDELNTARRAEEAEIVKQAEEQIKDIDLTEERILVLKSEKWNAGIVGIAAARLMEKYYRPVILLTQNDGVLTGSARSTPEIDLFDAMEKFSGLCMKFGGHSFAAGLTMKEENFAEYKNNINEYIVGKYPFTTFIPKKRYDTQVRLKEVTRPLIEMMQKLAPFGEGNPPPTLVARDLHIRTLKRIGNNLTHLNGKVSDDSTYCDIVAFEKGDLFDTLMNAESCDIAFSPAVNEWGNTERIQLRVSDFSVSPIRDAHSYFERMKDKFMNAFVQNLKAEGHCEQTGIRYCSMSFIKSAFKSSHDGTLVLCMDSESAEKLAYSVNDDNCYADVAVESLQNTVCPFNTVLYAPVIEKLRDTADRYHRIIITGSISLSQVCAIKEIVPNATVFLAEDLCADSREAEACRALCTHDNMGKVYLSAMRVLRKKSMFKQDLCALISAETGYDAALCGFSIDIFIELGLFFVDNNDRITPNNDGKKVELASSPLYNRAANFTCFNK